jgi:hypothetical protein
VNKPLQGVEEKLWLQRVHRMLIVTIQKAETEPEFMVTQSLMVQTVEKVKQGSSLGAYPGVGILFAHERKEVDATYSTVGRGG